MQKQINNILTFISLIIGHFPQLLKVITRN